MKTKTKAKRYKISAERYKRENPYPMREVTSARTHYGRLWLNLSCGHATIIDTTKKLPKKAECHPCWCAKFREINGLPQFP